MAGTARNQQGGALKSLVGICAHMAAGVNNGILLIRNSEWSRHFWGEVTSHATTEVRRIALRLATQLTANLRSWVRGCTNRGSLALSPYLPEAHAQCGPLWPSSIRT